MEEKHQHSREALEHFRESVKEQRRHEHEIQQLQAAERQTDQNLSIRLNEIAQLNRDNARLVAEVSKSRKRASEQESKIANLERALREKEDDYKAKCRDLESATANNQALSEEIALLRDKQEIPVFPFSAYRFQLFYVLPHPYKFSFRFVEVKKSHFLARHHR